jgi:hypothetical protein
MNNTTPLTDTQNARLLNISRESKTMSKNGAAA